MLQTRTCLTNEILGSANPRSEDQRNKAKLIVKDYVSNNDKNSLICYTDGSALGNPGPCGTGAAIYRLCTKYTSSLEEISIKEVYNLSWRTCSH